jgi:uncharacterized protein (TIGR03435 family)
MRLLTLAVVSMGALSCAAQQAVAFTPMAADANPGFDVATIKPSANDASKKGIAVQGDIFHALNMSPRALLAVAFEVQEAQINGGPKWLDDERYDVSGRPDTAGQPNEHQWNSMLKKLLVERLALQSHPDTTPMAAYALFVMKGGPKLRIADEKAAKHASMYFTKLGRLVAQRVTMADFCGLLQGVVFDRPVLDQTALQGMWDFALNWSPEPGQFKGMGAAVTREETDPNAPPPIFTAIHEQLGLEMKADTYPVPVVVIDAVSKPAAN